MTEEIKIEKFVVKSCQPYAKGWQVNATVNGIESECTYYGYTKNDAIKAAQKTIAIEGKLPHPPYKGE